MTGIAFDDSGNLYAAVDSDFIPVGAPGTINKYSPVGAPLGIFASTGLFSPYGLAFDSAGNLYAANFGSGAVEKFSPSGTDLSVFAPGLSTPRDVVVVELVVSYACAGFEAPLQESLTLKHQVQRTIPLKIQLFSDGTPITDLNIVGGPPVVKVEFSADGGTPVDVTSEVVPVGHSSTGNAFGFDPVSGFWSFNLDTRPFAAPGTYTVTAQSGDTATYVLGPTCSGEFVRLP